MAISIIFHIINNLMVW